MKKTASSITIAALVGLVIGILIATGRGGALAQNPIGSGNLGSHHKDFSISVPSEGLWTPNLPVVDRPVHINGTVTGFTINGQVQPTMLFSGTVVKDSVTGYVRLISSSIDTVSALSGDGTIIVSWHSSDVSDAALQVVASTSAGEVYSPVTYHVSMWY
jgi:hypothetical protein